MSGETIPLQVIYNRLEPSTSAYSALPINYESSSLDSVFVEKPKTKQSKKKGINPCARFCVCLWTLFVTSCLVVSIMCILASYYQFKGCVDSPHFTITEMITSPENVHEINFNVVTGSVLFDIHDSDDLVVKVYRSARESDYLEEIEATVNLKDNVIFIESLSPAFDYDTCQFAYVEVLFPSDILKQVNAVSITGKINAGYISLGYLSNVAHVRLSVDVGYISMEGLNTNSIDAQTGLGAIWAESIWNGGETKLSVNTGSINTRLVQSKIFESKIVYGSSWNSDITSDDAKVHTEYGYSALLRPNHFTPETDQTVAVSAHYGKALAVYDEWYNLDFNLNNKHGEATFVFDNEECSLDEQEEALLGSCPFDVSLAPKSTVTVSVCYGTGLLLQEESDWDELESNFDFQEGDYEEEDFDKEF